MKKTTMKAGQVEVTKLPKPTTSGALKAGKLDQKTDKKEVGINRVGTHINYSVFG